MLQTVLDAKPAGESSTARDTTLAAYRFMLLARLLDDKFAALYRAGKIHGGVFLARGQEALSASIGVSLKKTDVFAPLIRDTAGRLGVTTAAIDNALYIPRQAVFDPSGKPTVYVKSGDGPSEFTPRDVKVRAWTDSLAVVENLLPGTEVALVDPTKSGSRTRSATAPFTASQRASR